MREILECWFAGRPIRNEYLIVDAGKLAGAGAHSCSAGDAPRSSEEAARFKAAPGRCDTTRTKTEHKELAGPPPQPVPAPPKVMRESRSLNTLGFALPVSSQVDLRALQEHGGNVSAAARALGNRRSTIYHDCRR